MVVLVLCVVAVASEAMPAAGHSGFDDLTTAAAVQNLRDTLRAFEAKQAVPKPLPQSHNVEMWLGGVQYKSRMSPPWTDTATGRRLRLATGFGRRDVVVPVESDMSGNGGTSSTSWRVRPFREYGFGESQVVRVSPSGLDFGVRETCIPTLLSVEVSYRVDAIDAEDGVDSRTNELLPLQIHGIEIDDKQFLLADVFQAVTLQPGDGLKFHVLFLPHRHSSAIHSTLTFQTSLGDIPYPLRGSGVPNRYRVSEFTASIAAGVQYDPVIYVYNPHHKMLRVKEVFTTEGFLHMELPQHPSRTNSSDVGDIPQDPSPAAAAAAARGVWEIEAATMKPVMQLSFLSSTPGRYSAYVRIETDFDNLIVPVELTVLSEGLHLGATHLNFGVLVNDDEEHHIAVDFVNTGRTTVLVKGVSLRSPDSRISVVIQGSHAVGPMSRVKHAMVVSYGSADPGTFTGMLIVHTNDTTTVNPSTHGRGHGGDIYLNYTATKVSGGGLSFAPDDIQFTSCGGPGRGLVLTNHFDTAVAIEMVQLADPSLFSLHNFSGNTVADAGTSWPPIYFDCIIDVDENGTTTSPTLSSAITTHTHSHLLVQTNVSRHVIPLVLSSNRLTLQTSSKRWQVMSTEEHAAAADRVRKKADVARPKSVRLPRRAFRVDLGNISSSRHVRVNLTNFNPTAIPVHSIVAHLSSVEVSLEPMKPHLAASVIAHDGRTTVDTEASFADSSDEEDACSADPPLTSSHAGAASSTEQPRSCRSKGGTKATVIPPGHALPMVLHITPTSPAVTDVLAFTISTSAEAIDVYLTYTQVRGSIHPTRRKLRTASPLYPGRAEVLPLFVDSTFDFPVTVSAIRVSDRRVQVLSQASALAPNATTLVAQLVVSPAYALGCASPDKFADCMLPVPIGGGEWTASPGAASGGALSTFGQPVTQADVNAHFHRLQRFADLETQGDTLVEMKVIVYTDLVAVAPVIVRMPIARPRLVVDSSTSPTSAGMVETPLTHVGNVSEVWLTVTNPSNVTIDVALALLASKDTDNVGASGGFYTCPGSSPSKLATCQETWMAAATSGAGGAIVVPAFFLASMTKQSLAPGDVTSLGPIMFAPTAAKEFVGRLYLRNTLSHIEPVIVRGHGGQGHISVVNNVVLESHAPPHTLAMQNDGNMPLVLHGWSCPKCAGCGGNDAGFCVQFPGSHSVKTTMGAFPVVLAPHGSSLFHLNASFVSACYFNHERESVVLHTSSGNVSVQLEGSVAYPYRECLGTSRMSYFYLGFRVVVWGLFALVVSQIVHYTVQIVWMDCHTTPADTNFGYEPPVVADSAASTLAPDGIDADLLEDELQSIETQVFDSFTFAPIRSPAVQRLLDLRKAALVKKPAPVVSKKKTKPKKSVPPTQPIDLVATADKANSAPSDDKGAVKVAASAQETSPPCKNAPAVKAPKSRHKTPLAAGSNFDNVEKKLYNNAGTVPSSSDEGKTEATCGKDTADTSFVKDGQLQPAIATSVNDVSIDTVQEGAGDFDKLSSATPKTEHGAEPDAVPAFNNEYNAHPVAQSDQGHEQCDDQASDVVDVLVLDDSLVAAIDAGMDFNDADDVSADVDTVVGDDDVIESDGDVIRDDDDTSERGDAEGSGNSQSSGEADTEEVGDNDESDEAVDDQPDVVEDNVQDADDDDGLDNDAVDDLSWATQNNPVAPFVDQTSRDNTIVLDEIDQLMQEVHNEQQFLQQHQEVYPPSPERGSPASWRVSSQPHSSHEAFGLPFLHPSFPPAAPSPVAVRAPPGFSAADADPLAVSRAYSQMGHLSSPPPNDLPPPDTNAFKAPLVLFGSSYFTGHRPGFIGSHRQSRGGGPTGTLPPAPGPPHRFKHEPPLRRNQYHSQGRSLASLVAGDAPFESSRDVFLNPESSPMQQRDGRFSFW